MIRMELLAAPETVRQVDSDTLRSAARAYELMQADTDGQITRASFAASCIRNSQLRALIGLPPISEHDDGSRELCEALHEAVTTLKLASRNRTSVRNSCDRDRASTTASLAAVPAAAPAAAGLIIRKRWKRSFEAAAVLTYDEFKLTFVGVKRAVAALTSKSGSTLASSVSAAFVNRVWSARVNGESRDGVF